MSETSQVDLVEIKKQINTQLGDTETLNALLKTTFKNLTAEKAKQAVMEGMIRGFTLQDFLQKNIYAVPFSGGYTLITSIDYSRKIGMRSGVVGKSAPLYEEKDGKIVSCAVTIKKKIDDTIGEFTATVYFDEYNTNKNQWVTKPRTMIAKVAEMHALRMACPEELSESYVEEELEKEMKVEMVPTEDYRAKLEATKTLEELQAVWSNMPAEAKKELEPLKNELKAKYASTQVSG